MKAIKIKIDGHGEYEFEHGITPSEIFKKLDIKEKPLLATFNHEIISLKGSIIKSGTLKFHLDTKDSLIFKEASKIFRKYLTEHLLENKKVIKEVEFNLTDNEFYVDYEVESSLSENELEPLKNFIIKKLSKLGGGSTAFALNPALIRYGQLFNLSGVDNDEGKLINRIYGFVALDQNFLEEKILELKDRHERDHRTVAKNLDIFFISPEVGKGLPIWLPNGVKLKTIIKDFIVRQDEKYNYNVVETPVIASKNLYLTSGHYEHYHENMFPEMAINDQETVMLRPMACPHHIMIFKRKIRTYKEMPVRFSEQVNQYRYEPSGSLLGLERVRAMYLSDSHVFLREDQIEQEIDLAFRLIENTLRKFGIEIDYIELALHDPEDVEKYHGDLKLWEKSEKILENYLVTNEIKYIKKTGEAAFYGPKIDIQIKTALGHTITVSTVQLDFLLPEKFDITYLNSENKPEKAIMIHRGLIGTYERFISILLEQTKGHFPIWLAPIQAVIIPISEKSHKYANDFYEYLRDNDVRVKFDDNYRERTANKIRIYQGKKINIQFIIGQKESEGNFISYRLFGETKTHEISRKDVLKLFK